MANKRSISLTLTPYYWEKLDNTAKNQQTTVSQLVRFFVIEGLREVPGVKSRPKELEKPKEIKINGIKFPSDEHKEYFEDKDRNLPCEIMNCGEISILGDWHCSLHADWPKCEKCNLLPMDGKKVRIGSITPDDHLCLACRGCGYNWA